VEQNANITKEQRIMGRDFETGNGKVKLSPDLEGVLGRGRARDGGRLGEGIVKPLLTGRQVRRGDLG
jgi:hypothetical protein